MKLRSNRFKQAIAAGEQQLGLWLALADPYSAELVATLGYDWLVIDAEHAPNAIGAILAQLQAVAPYLPEPVVRVAANDAVEIKRVLDIGARTLLVPMVADADEAAAAVAATRYPPRGIRGVGSALARAARWGQVDGYIAEAEADICILVQVETAAAVDRIEAICGVDGVDGVFIGAADLAADMGLPGRPGDPAVQAKVHDAIRRIRQAGKPAGILSSDAALARGQIAAGANFAAIGSDVGVLARAARELLAGFSGSSPATGDVY